MDEAIHKEYLCILALSHSLALVFTSTTKPTHPTDSHFDLYVPNGAMIT
jgi:hypothetical protein